MRAADHPALIALLTRVMASYGKPLPEAALLKAWFEQLQPFSPRTIELAFQSYAAERPDFAPVPNSIVARCKLADGRPEENEAWALALSSQDERETVIWTEEMRDAFQACKLLLERGDDVAARMAFKDAYARLVAEARAVNRPAKWDVSAGWDAERRQLVVSRAVHAGLLAAPEVRLALPNGVVDGELPDARPEGLKRVLEAVRELEDPFAKAERLSREANEREEERKRQIAAQVEDYQQGHKPE